MRIIRGESVCLVVACSLLAASACAATQYTLTELPSWSSYQAHGYAGVSNEGHVVGQWSVGPESRGYIWEAGSTIELSYRTTFVQAVNSQGQVTGGFPVSPLGLHAYRWDGGVMTDLGVLPGGLRSAGFDINEDGVVVGYAYDAAEDPHACMWVGTTITDLGGLGGSEAFAFGINDQGQIVGAAADAVGDRHAFLWLPTAAYGLSAGMNDLGTFGGLSSQALGINNAGQIIGGSHSLNGHWSAWVWDNGSTTFLGDSGSQLIIPEDINNLGQVVGVDDYLSYPFLWENGSMIDLNDCVAPGSGWVLMEACGINDSGWIVGYGIYNGETRCFLLTPIPEPGTLALAGIGLLALLLRRRRG